MDAKLQEKQKQQQKQALKFIKKQVMTLRKKMCSYGISSQQFTHLMQSTIGKLLVKSKSNKIKTQDDLMKAIDAYGLQNKGKYIKLLLQIISNIESQIAQLQSSSYPNQQQEENKPERPPLKIQDKRSQYLDGNLGGERKKYLPNSQNQQDICYVKLEALPDLNNQLLNVQESPLSSHKRKPKSRRKKKGYAQI